MKKLLALLFVMVATLAQAREQVNIYSKYDVTDTANKQLIFLVKYLNDNNTKYRFKINTILGAYGEASIRRSIVEARTGNKSVLFTSIDTFTLNKELELAETEYKYDKHKDFYYIRGISGSTHGVLTPLDVKDFDELLTNLRSQKEFFYGYSSTSIITKLSTEAIIKHFNLTNGKPVAFKTQTEMQFSLLKKEVSFSITTPENIIASGDVKQVMTSGPQRNPFYPDLPTGQERGIKDFLFAAQTFFAVPKEQIEFGKEIEPLITAACFDSEFNELQKTLKRFQSCIDGPEIEDRIKNEYIWFMRNK
jgi:tripartite-type tricarboxylate transporter receptor subunit TctC